MKLRKLSVKNYKVFDHLDLDFTDSDGKTLDKIVFAGLNGTGKTTILELIQHILNGDFFPVPPNFQIELECDLENSTQTESLYQLFLQKYPTEKEQIKLEQSFLVLNYSNKTDDFDNLFLFNKFMGTYYEIFSRTSKPYFYRPYSINPDTFRNVNESILKSIKDKVFANLDTPPKQVIENEIKVLTRIFKDMKFNSRLVGFESEQLIFESANHQRIKFEDLSSGEKSLYFMGFFLSKFNTNNSIILIDEPEDSLHPTWQQQICQFYSNIGTNNQVFLATHSPYVIASVPAQNVFLLKNENNSIAVYQPKYSQGHSIPYVLSEIMETDYRDTYINTIVNQYLELIQEGKHETEEGQKLWEEIEKLDVNSEERLRINFSLRRFKAIGK